MGILLYVVVIGTVDAVATLMVMLLLLFMLQLLILLLMLWQFSTADATVHYHLSHLNHTQCMCFSEPE